MSEVAGPRAAATHLRQVAAAAGAAEQEWAGRAVSALTCAESADRELIREYLRSAGRRSGERWAARFALGAGGLTLSSAILFASVIGAVGWAVHIPSRHWPAALTALAYLMIAVVIAPACWRQAHQISDHFRRISPGAWRQAVVRYVHILVGWAIIFGFIKISTAHLGNQASAEYYVGEFWTFAGVTVVGLIPAYLALAYGYAKALTRKDGADGEDATGGRPVLDWAGALLATAVTRWLPASRRQQSDGDTDLDCGLLRLLGCTLDIDRMSDGRSATPQTVKSVILALELAAADVESYAVKRVPLGDLATRRIVREDGARRAATIRGAKARLARAVRAGDYAAIAASLARTLVALVPADADSPALMTGGGPPVGRVPVWRRVADRVWQAVALAAAGVFLPLLPLYGGDHAAASGLRYALLTAAVGALVTGRGTVAETIGSSLESALQDAPAK